MQERAQAFHRPCTASRAQTVHHLSSSRAVTVQGAPFIRSRYALCRMHMHLSRSLSHSTPLVLSAGHPGPTASHWWRAGVRASLLGPKRRRRSDASISRRVNPQVRLRSDRDGRKHARRTNFNGPPPAADRLAPGVRLARNLMPLPRGPPGSTSGRTRDRRRQRRC